MKNARYWRQAPFEIIHLKNKPFVYREHNHVSVFTIGLVLQGEITVQCGDKQTLYSANSYFIIAPYQVHTLYLPKTYDFVTICIHKDSILPFSSDELFAALSPILPEVSARIHDALLREALEHILRSPAVQPPNTAILMGALAVCHAPEEFHSIEAMAENACYSLYHYIKLFKRSIGVTPHKFQTQNRIRKAQRMIEQGQPLTSIALDLGFYDQSHFIKCFKQIVGFTPAAYSNICRRLP